MKQLSSFLCALCLCALLFCALALLFPLQEQTFAKREMSASSSRHPLCRFTAADLDQICFKSPEEQFSLVNQGSHFLLNNSTDIPLSLPTVSDLLHLFENFPSGSTAAVLQRPADLEIKLLPTSGDELTLLIWQEQASLIISNGSLIQELPIEKVSPLLRTAADYADCQLTGVLPASATLNLHSKLYETDLILSYYTEENTAYGSLTAPVTKPVPQDQLVPLLNSLQGLNADQVFVLNPTIEIFEACGLLNPFCTLSLSSEEETWTLQASHPQGDGTVFLLKEGLPLIFQCNQDKLPWLSMSMETLLQENIFQCDYGDCISFTLQTEIEKVRFTKWDGLVLQGNKSIDEKLFRTFFREATTMIPCQRILSPVSADTPLLTITISYTNPEQPSDVLRFLPYSEKLLALSINGEQHFLLPEETLHRILNKCQQILAP